MWAHYADNYAGAVIEFDGAHEFFNGAFDIQYSSHRPIRDFTLYSNEPIPIAEMCEKSIEWEYEKEVRVARSLSDCQFSRMGSDFPIFVMDVPIECISGVILGERVSQDITIAIFRLIESNTIRGNRAVVNHWDYNLELTGFKIGPYKSGGKEISAFTFRNYRHFPSL